MPDNDLAQRRSLLTTALVGALLPKDVPEGKVLRAWLDSWAGIGHVTTGMARQGHDLQLTRYGDEAWRATFYVSGRAHSLVTATAWEKTPWRAVHKAALGALGRSEEPRRRSGPPPSSSPSRRRSLVDSVPKRWPRWPPPANRRRPPAAASRSR